MCEAFVAQCSPPGLCGQVRRANPCEEVPTVPKARRCLQWCIALSLVLVAGVSALALDADDWEWNELVGYAIVSVTRHSGEFTGSEAGKRIVLDNGWVFEFTRYRYYYAYYPRVVVFVKVDDTALGPEYRLLINTELFDAR